MRRQALLGTVLVMLAAGLVALAVRAAADASATMLVGAQRAYFFVNVAGLALASILLFESVRRRELRRFIPGFALIMLVMAVRLGAQVFPLPLQADILMVSATLPVGLAGGAMVIWQWQRMRTAGTRVG